MLECALVFHRRGILEAGDPAQDGHHAHLPEDSAKDLARDLAYNRRSCRLDEIFIVPVCSMLADNAHAYLDFLREVGALERAARVIAAARLHQPRAAELARRAVRAIVTEAEVQALAPQIDLLSL